MGKFFHISSMSSHELGWRFTGGLTYDRPPPEAPHVMLVRLPIQNEIRVEITNWIEDYADGSVYVTDTLESQYRVFTRPDVMVGQTATVYHILMFFSSEQDLITLKLKYSDTLNFEFKHPADDFKDCWRQVTSTKIPLISGDWYSLPIENPVDSEYFKLADQMKMKQEEERNKMLAEIEYQRIQSIRAHELAIAQAKKQEEELKAKYLEQEQYKPNRLIKWLECFKKS